MRAIRLVSRALQRLGLANGGGADPRQRVILMYHGVADRPTFNCVTTDQLRAQLRHMQARYRVVPITEMIRIVAEEAPSGAPLLALTFDDAYESFLTLAYPALRELALPAGVAIPSGHVGGVNQWDVDQGAPPLRLMSWSQLRELDPRHVEFGSHSVSHRSFGALSEAEAREEARASKAAIEAELSCAVEWFAYPYGKLADIHPRSEAILAEVGYRGACSTRWGRWNRAGDRYMLRRIDVWPTDTLGDFAAKLDGYYDWLAPKEALAFRVRRALAGRRGA